MDKNFEELTAGIEYIFKDSSSHAKKKAAQAIVSLWGELRHEGVEALDFARAALLVSGCVVTCHGTMPEMLRFATDTEKNGRQKLDILKAKWPNTPVDDDVWRKGLHSEE